MFDLEDGYITYIHVIYAVYALILHKSWGVLYQLLLCVRCVLRYLVGYATTLSGVT